jgi:3-oxoacyl-[acyl-carrier protein] reductase
MLEDLREKVAFVTGGTRGIGLETVRCLVRLGVKVVLTGTSASAASQVAAEIQASIGGEVSGIGLDLLDSASVSRVIDEVVERNGRIDILVNNAGLTRDGLVLRMGDDDWETVLTVNLKGVFLTTRSVLRGMLKRRQGAIVNISSVVGLMGNAGQANYTAAKAGVIGLTKSVAREYAGKGIRANVVAPGFIETDMTATMKEEQRVKLQAQIPLNRLGRGEDIASVVAFLASDAASYITGQVLTVDGGLRM